MNTNLKIEPAKRNKVTLSKVLKFALEKGSISFSFPTVLDHNYLDYFKGLKDAGIEDAQQVIDMINVHKYVNMTNEE